MVATGSLCQWCHQPSCNWCPSKAFGHPLVAQSLPHSFSLSLLSPLSSPGVFPISTVICVSPLPFPPAAGVHWEKERDIGLNRSHTNSGWWLTAPSWAPRQGTAHCSGESAPPPMLLPAVLACSLPAPCIICLLTLSCLAPSHGDEPLPHPAKCSNTGWAQLTPIQIRRVTVAAASSAHGLGEPWHHPGTMVAPSWLCPGTILALSWHSPAVHG